MNRMTYDSLIYALRIIMNYCKFNFSEILTKIYDNYDTIIKVNIFHRFR